MKKDKKIKLNFSKEVIANLNRNEMNDLKGGDKNTQSPQFDSRYYCQFETQCWCTPPTTD